jgi:hypothetical protein
VSIKSGNIVVKLVIHERTDPRCCPSLRIEQEYSLQGDALVEQSPETKSQ